MTHAQTASMCSADKIPFLKSQENKKKTRVSLTQMSCKCNINKPLAKPTGRHNNELTLKIKGTGRHFLGRKQQGWNPSG